jgi:hypothetical protein
MRLSQKNAACAAAIGFVITLVAGFPGWMSSDSLDQYRQALTTQFTDWHPPVMAAIWSVASVFAPGPLGMLVFHLGLYWGALLLLASLFTERKPVVAAAILLAGLLPFTANLAPIIWKDVGVAVYLMMAAALLVASYVNKREPSLLVLILLFLASASRWNAWLAVVPLVFLFCHLRLAQRSWTLKITLAMFVVGIIPIAISFLNYTVLGAKRTFPWQAIAMHDLAALGCARHPERVMVPQQFLTVHSNEQRVCAAYAAGIADPLFFPSDAPFRFNQAGTEDLVREWLASVRSNPIAYLEHRTKFYLAFLRVGQSHGDYLIHAQIDTNDLGLEHRPNAVSVALLKYTMSFSSTPFVKPWFWLSALLVILAVSASQRHWLASAVLLSGLLYLLPYYFVGLAPSFRYAYWSIWACLIGVAVLIAVHRATPLSAEKHSLPD